MQKVGTIAGDGLEFMKQIINDRITDTLHSVVNDSMIYHINSNHPHPVVDQLINVVDDTKKDIGKLQKSINYKEEDEIIYVIFDGGKF